MSTEALAALKGTLLVGSAASTPCTTVVRLLGPTEDVELLCLLFSVPLCGKQITVIEPSIKLIRNGPPANICLDKGQSRHCAQFHM